MSVPIAAPPVWKTALEYRSLAERTQMSLNMPLLRRLPHGDGHPVLVLPGFMASDRSTQPLRRLLRDMGYRTYGWGLGVNVGPTERILEGLARKLDRAFRKSGQPVSIIGWSLGGIFARELTRARPDQVRQVIMLGSPIQMVEEDSSSAQPLWDVLRHHHAASIDRSVRDIDRPEINVPSTSIYSKSDGIVSWQSCLVEQTDHSENVRVFGSHCGLGYNTSVIAVIADRLAQPVAVWRPFSAPWYLRGMYPPAVNLDRKRLVGTLA
jgi:pimeloyl-ACP methyl ester carboxylesterase